MVPPIINLIARSHFASLDLPGVDSCPLGVGLLSIFRSHSRVEVVIYDRAVPARANSFTLIAGILLNRRLLVVDADFGELGDEL